MGKYIYADRDLYLMEGKLSEYFIFRWVFFFHPNIPMGWMRHLLILYFKAMFVGFDLIVFPLSFKARKGFIDSWGWERSIFF